MKICLKIAAVFLFCCCFSNISPIAGQETEQVSKALADQTKTKLLPTVGGATQSESSNTTGKPATATSAKPAAAKPVSNKPVIVKPDPSDQQFDLTFDDLKFEMEKGGDFDRTMLTDKINAYHGGKISIRGYIRPSFSQSGLTKFIFVRDNKECCFGPGAAIYDCVLVRLKKGLETDYTVRPVSIEGKFALKEYKGPDGKVWSIYRMTDAFVK